MSNTPETATIRVYATDAHRLKLLAAARGARLFPRDIVKEAIDALLREQPHLQAVIRASMAQHDESTA